MALDTTCNVPLKDRPQRIRGANDSAPKPSGRFPRWHCISTNWGQDYLAEAELRRDGWEVYLPLHIDRHRYPARITPAFGGYIFARFDAAADDWARICHTRGVYRILGKPGRPEPLPVGLIEHLIERTSARRVLDDPGQDSNVVYLQPGARARVTEGPFAGWEGVCTMSRQNRIRLLLALFGGPREVEFKPALVAPLEG